MEPALQYDTVVDRYERLFINSNRGLKSLWFLTNVTRYSVYLVNLVLIATSY